MSLMTIGSRTSVQVERMVLSAMAQATRSAALAAAHARGRNNGKFADGLAVAAMRKCLDDELVVSAEVVIGEGDRDKAPMLHIGERLGPDKDGKALVRIAVDPLEGTNPCARNEPGAITVIAAALDGRGSLMGGVDGYFNKVVIGPDLHNSLKQLRGGATPFQGSSGFLLDQPVDSLVRWIAHVREKPVHEVSVMVLDRPYNAQLIKRLRMMNVQLRLILDGDVTAGLLALDSRHDIDLAIGRGAAPEGVITAAIANVYGGYMEARWYFPEDERGTIWRRQLQEREVEVESVYTIDQLAPGKVMFALTTVTRNDFLPGVKYVGGGMAETYTIYGRSESGTLYEEKAAHAHPPAAPTEWPEVDDEA